MSQSATISDAFFENALEMACVASGERLTKVNGRWSDVLGWSEDELLSRPFLEFVHPEDRASTAEAVGRLFSGEPIVQFRNRYARKDGTWAVVEWNSIADVDAGVIYGRARDVTAESLAVAERDRMHRVVAVQAELQDLFLRHGVDRVWWDLALNRLIEVTGSAFGFVGRVETGSEGEPLLRSLAITDIAWNDWSRQAFDQFAHTGLEFRNLDSLYGTTLSTGRLVISDDPSTDPRRCGLPEGHPPLGSYVGIPLIDGGGLMGMVGLANREGGYDEGIVGEVAPVLSVMTHIIARDHADRRIAQATRRIEDLAQGEEEHLAVARGVDQILGSATFHDAARVAREALLRIVPHACVATYACTPDAPDVMTLVEGARELPVEVRRDECRAFDSGRVHVGYPAEGVGACGHVPARAALSVCAAIHTDRESFGLLVVTECDGRPGLPPEAGRAMALTDAADRLAGALAQVALRDHLTGKALVDELTGLSNRTAFLQALDRRLQLLHASARPFGVLLLDLDDFKDVNDRLGHLAGDDALRGFGDAIRASVRDSDVAARLGGDEFVVLVASGLPGAVRATAERIIERTAEVRDAGGTTLSASSGGVMVGWGSPAWADVYASADRALYEAKAAGKGRLVMSPMLGRPAPGGVGDGA